MQDKILQMKCKKSNEVELPQTIIDEFARFLVPEIRRFYGSEEGGRKFAEWQHEKKLDEQKA